MYVAASDPFSNMFGSMDISSAVQPGGTSGPTPLDLNLLLTGGGPGPTSGPSMGFTTPSQPQMSPQGVHLLKLHGPNVLGAKQTVSSKAKPFWWPFAAAHRVPSVPQCPFQPAFAAHYCSAIWFQHPAFQHHDLNHHHMVD